MDLEADILQIRLASLLPDDVEAAAWSTLFAVLDPNERDRAARLYHNSDRQTFVAAHALLRHMLSELGHHAPADWRFHTSPSGKPYLEPAFDAEGLHFNLSHARGMVLVGVTHGIEIGVDVELTNLDQPGLDIATRFFDPSEIRILNDAGTDQARAERFTVMWTIKEAMLKAIGSGLLHPLNSITVKDLSPLRVEIADSVPAHAAQWQVHLGTRGPYRYACAFTVPENRLVRIDYTEMKVEKRGGWLIETRGPAAAVSLSD